MNNKTIFSCNFLILICSQIISMFGNQIIRYILPLYVLFQTNSAQQFALLMSLSFIPMLIMLPIGGIIADRLNKKKTMIMLDLFTALLLISYYLYSSSSEFNFYVIAIVIMILNVVKAIYQPTVQSSTIFIVDEKYILRANSIIDVISSSSNIIGPIIAGILINIIEIRLLVLICSILFLFSSLILIFLKINNTKFVSNNVSIIKYIITDLKLSANFIFKSKPQIFKLSLVYSTINLVITPIIIVVLPIVINTKLDFTQVEANYLYGFANGFVSVGALLGGVFTTLFANKLKISSLLIIFKIILVLLFSSFLILLISTNSYLIYLDIVVSSMMLLALSTIFTVILITYIQSVTPRDLIGKVISTTMLFCMITSPFGQYIYGILISDNLSISIIYLIATAIIFFTTIYIKKIKF